MAFTSVLGTPESRLGNFALGQAESGSVDPLSPVVNQALSLLQTVGISKTLNLSVSQTLSLTQSGHKLEPLTPIVGYSGGNTRYVHVRDITAGQDLYVLNTDFAFTYPASTTKVLTAYMIMQYKSTVLDSDIVTFNTDDVTLPGGISTGGFLAGDTCTWRELLYAIFVASAGDACQCAARYIGTDLYVAGGSTGDTGMARFVDQMNITAAALGMSNSFYDNPWGYSQNGGTTHNIMSARDLSTVAALTLTQADILIIAATATYTLTPGGPNSHTLNWSNVNYFINGPANNPSGIADANCLGGKVGEWTIDGSHLNLTQLYQAPNGNLIIITTMNSESYQAMQFDQQGIIYALLKDWPYLEDSATRTDPDFTDVRILIGGNGSIVDESVVGRSFTNSGFTVGDPIIEVAHSLANASDTSYLSVPDATDLYFDTGDATVEVWFAGACISGGEIVFFGKLGIGVNREYAINYYDPGKTIGLFVSSDGVNWSTVTAFALSNDEAGTLFNGATRHIALVKSGSTWTVYLDGEAASSTVSVSNTSRQTAVGVSIAANNTNAIVGGYADFRVTVGAARYIAAKETLYARPFPRSISGDQAVTQTLILTDVPARNITSNQGVSQSLTLTDAARRSVTGVASDTITITDLASGVKYKFVSASDTLTLTQAVAVNGTYGRSLFQSLTFVQAPVRSMTYALGVVDSLTLSQLDPVSVSKLATNTLVLTQDAEYTYSHGARDVVELTQTIFVNGTYLRSLFDTLGIFQTVSVNGTHNVSASNVLALMDHVAASLTKSVLDTLVLTQVATGERLTPAFDTVNLTQLVSNNHTSNRQLTTTLALTQVVAVEKSFAGIASNALGFNQFARGTKVLTWGVADSLVLSQALVQEYFDEASNDTLVFTQVAIAPKIGSPKAVDQLSLTDAVSLSKTLSRSVTDTLVFLNSYPKYIGIAAQPYVDVPVVYGVLVKKKTILTLEAPGLSIVLPGPQFNDGEAGTATLTVKRAMDGTRRIYRRDSPTSKLKYDFVMDRIKAIELRNFILVNNSKTLKMTNHKGEVWYVILTNSPTTFEESAYWASSWGNKSTVTLELEGTRIS